MQCHNYISDVYNKPNRLKIGWKLTKLLFKKYMYHYQHNVMGERVDCGKMAAMCGRSTPLAGNADETSSVYIYLWFSSRGRGKTLEIRWSLSRRRRYVWRFNCDPLAHDLICRPLTFPQAGSREQRNPDEKEMFDFNSPETKTGKEMVSAPKCFIHCLKSKNVVHY